MNFNNTSTWKFYINEAEEQAGEVTDEVLSILFSDEIEKILTDPVLSEALNLADKAKYYAKKYGIPLALATSLVTGTLAGTKLANMQNAAEPPEVSQPAPQEPTESAPPGFEGLSNREAISHAWELLEGLPRANAPISGTAPVLSNGRMINMRFVHIPYSELSDDMVLPLSMRTVASYRADLEAKLERSPQELIYLKRMIFGDTGKWLSGEGNSQFRIENEQALLPPGWSIAHGVYADAVEARMRELVEYAETHPDLRNELYEPLGVSSDEEFNRFVQLQFQKIGRNY
jgi:hypothetical protein